MNANTPRSIWITLYGEILELYVFIQRWFWQIGRCEVYAIFKQGCQRLKGTNPRRGKTDVKILKDATSLMCNFRLCNAKLLMPRLGNKAVNFLTIQKIQADDTYIRPGQSGQGA